MFTSISKTIGSSMPTTATLQFVLTTAIIGRKVVLGACCKIGAKVAEIFEKQNVEEWNKAGDEYFALATKSALRDLTLVASPIAFSLAANTSPSTTFVLSQLSFVTAAIIAGRKMGFAGACKVSALAKTILNHPDVKDWDQSSSDYLGQAKKDAVDDLKNAVPFVLMGVGFHIGGEIKTLGLKRKYYEDEIAKIDEDVDYLKKFYYLLTKVTSIFS